MRIFRLELKRVLKSRLTWILLALALLLSVLLAYLPTTYCYSNYTDELAADRKAAKNIMNAIEQGIFTAMTKDRLLELELDISTLEKSIALARAASEETVMEKERIILTLEQLRDGDVTSKDYQKRLFDTFVKAVYLWDDKIEVHYYYSGEKNVLTSSLKEAAGGSGSGPGGVLINSPTGHQVTLK